MSACAVSACTHRHETPNTACPWKRLFAGGTLTCWAVPGLFCAPVCIPGECMGCGGTCGGFSVRILLQSLLQNLLSPPLGSPENLLSLLESCVVMLEGMLVCGSSVVG